MPNSKQSIWKCLKTWPPPGEPANSEVWIPHQGERTDKIDKKNKLLWKSFFLHKKMFSILSFFGLGPNSIDYLADIHHMKYTFASLAEDQKNSIYGHYCRIIEYEREKRFDRWQGPDVPSTGDCDPTGIFLKYWPPPMFEQKCAKMRKRRKEKQLKENFDPINFRQEMVWKGKKIGQITLLTPWPPAWARWFLTFFESNHSEVTFFRLLHQQRVRARYQVPWIVSIPPSMQNWGVKNYMENPKMSKNGNEKNDHLRANYLPCYTN